MRCYQCGEQTGQVCSDCKRPVCKGHRMGSFQDNERGQRSVVVRCSPCRGAFARRWVLLQGSDNGPAPAA